MPSAYPLRKVSPIKHTPLQEKKILQQEADSRLQVALARAKKAERARDHGPTKRRENAFLARYLALPLDSSYALRPEEGYRARSYNSARQVLGLVDHLFVQYRVPRFLYRSVLSAEGLELVFDVPRDPKAKGLPEAKYRPWFLAVARGESFAKASRDVFTKREAHLFLQAPDGRSIEETIFWTRALAADVPRAGCDFLVGRLDAALQKAIGDRMPDLLRFYAEAWPEMRGYDRDEITDFVRAMARDPDFSFKGRTFGSMRKRCAEWHRTSFSGHVREYRAWMPGFEPWEFRKGGVAVRAEELTNNRLLADEGRTQRHCVLTYTSLCLQGRSRIVSLRWYGVADPVQIPTHELARLTLEVSPTQRAIVQIRGKMNRGATEEEMRAVRHWAGDQGLTIATYA